MSSDCSIPALETMWVKVTDLMILKLNSQSLWLSSQGISHLLRAFIIPLSESNAQNENIAPAKLNSLRLGACFELVHGYGVRSPRVVRQNPILGKKLDQIQEN